MLKDVNMTLLFALPTPLLKLEPTLLHNVKALAAQRKKTV